MDETETSGRVEEEAGAAGTGPISRSLFGKGYPYQAASLDFSAAPAWQGRQVGATHRHRTRTAHAHRMTAKLKAACI